MLNLGQAVTACNDQRIWHGGFALSNEANAAQRQYWNSDFGEKWVAFEADLETLHAPMTEPLLARAAIGPGMRVLDVGCGSGSVARRAAELTGVSGAVTAVDISEVLLKTARASAAGEGCASVEYVLADAQTCAFAPASFDSIVSRMGVMFFADPIAAFANLRHAARPGAILSAVVWRRGEANPWFAIPKDAAVRHLGPVDSDPDAPGPLAFANADRTLALLAAAGWEDVRADPLPVILETRGTAREAAGRVGSIGPVARILNAKGATAEQVAAIVDEIAANLGQFQTDHGLRVPVTMTLLSATAPA
jgi:SAM-dependent methyltransferase